MQPLLPWTAKKLAVVIYALTKRVPVKNAAVVAIVAAVEIAAAVGIAAAAGATTATAGATIIRTGKTAAVGSWLTPEHRPDTEKRIWKRPFRNLREPKRPFFYTC